MTHTRVRAGLKRLTTAVAAIAVAGGLVACSDDGTGGDGEEPRAEQTPSEDASASDTESAPESTGKYDPIEMQSYTYVLDLTCQCRDYGRVEVTVEGDEAVSAVLLDDMLGVNPGEDAPDDFLITINDIIALANDPEIELVHVGWPPRLDYPRLVYLDPDERKPNDQTLYQIADVAPTG